MKILISSKQKLALKQHAQDESPLESCALLLGKKNNNSIVVKKIFKTKNIENSRYCFTISGDDLIRGYSKEEHPELDVVGIFHSHPDSDAFPSLTDKKYMDVNPVVWVIYSGPKQEFRAFILEDGLLELPIIDTNFLLK